jgi:hypothetical protein
VEQHRSWISIKHLTTKSAGKHTAWSDVSYGGEYNMENNKALNSIKHKQRQTVHGAV